MEVGTGGVRKKKVAKPSVAAAPEAVVAAPAKEKVKLTFKEKLEYETLEKRIAVLEKRLPVIDKEMAEQASDFDALGALMKERTDVNSELEASLERWMELAEQL